MLEALSKTRTLSMCITFVFWLPTSCTRTVMSLRHFLRQLLVYNSLITLGKSLFSVAANRSVFYRPGRGLMVRLFVQIFLSVSCRLRQELPRQIQLLGSPGVMSYYLAALFCKKKIWSHFRGFIWRTVITASNKIESFGPLGVIITQF